MSGSGPTIVAVIGVLVLLLAAGLPLAGAVGPRAAAASGNGTRSAGRPMAGPMPPTDNVSYNSSVDGFPLSYLEWLPAGYSASSTYPLAVFLHGVGQSSAPVRGGIGGIVDISSGLVDNASSSGFLLIALNTRSSSGFYVNTPCGGPQEQDVLDAITHEASLRHVSHVYLIGFSMGSLGAFSIAGHHPGLISGIATAGTITDIYETIAYDSQTHSEPSGLFDAMCGAHPSPTTPSVDRVWTYLSVLRFEPENFSGVPLFVASGGMDTRAPNNFLDWNYANVNNTFVNSTCVVVAGEGEPANCTVTIPSLANATPGSYRWLDVFEPDGTHSAQQLPAAAVFSFFLGTIQGGYYASGFPGGTLTPTTPSLIPPTHSPPAVALPWTWIVVGVVGLAAVVAVAAAVASRRRR
jgi:pimeloyl-ACP methyl ester carboxylesterase